MAMKSPDVFSHGNCFCNYWNIFPATFNCCLSRVLFLASKEGVINFFDIARRGKDFFIFYIPPSKMSFRFFSVRNAFLRMCQYFTLLNCEELLTDPFVHISYSQQCPVPRLYRTRFLSLGIARAITKTSSNWERCISLMEFWCSRDTLRT